MNLNALWGFRTWRGSRANKISYLGGRLKSRRNQQSTLLIFSRRSARTHEGERRAPLILEIVIEHRIVSHTLDGYFGRLSGA
jgi:hypothetical protein